LHTLEAHQRELQKEISLMTIFEDFEDLYGGQLAEEDMVPQDMLEKHLAEQEDPARL